MKRFAIAVTLVIVVVAGAVGLPAQRGGGLSPEQTAQRWDREKELQSLAVRAPATAIK